MAKLPTTQKVFDVVGEGRTNDDGSSRQGEMAASEPGEAVELVRQPNNAHDRNAIFVRSCRSIGIGFLTAGDAAMLAPAIDAGRPYTAKLHALTGGVADYPSYGAKVSIAWDGRPEHPHRPLDANQAASRQGKRSIQGRQRDGQGRLLAKEGSGCVVVLAMLLLPLAVIGLTACSEQSEQKASTASPRSASASIATLYRNSPLSADLRVHWATFDVEGEPPNYNLSNCQMAARLLNANNIASAKAEGKEPYPSVGFWCENGTYREEGSVPTTFPEAFPTDVEGSF